MSGRTVVIIQARMGSTRLPGKVMARVEGQPLLWHVVERVQHIVGIDGLILATTTDAEDGPLCDLASAWRIGLARGSAQDVLERYYRAACEARAETVVRVTADCPLFDPAIAGLVLARFRQGDADYASNAHPPTYPDGLDVEVLSMETLACAWREARLGSEREHVTPYVWKHPERFRLANVAHGQDLSELRWTVDEPRDLDFVRAVYARLEPREGHPAGLDEVLAVLDREPALLAINRGILRNEGYWRSVDADACPASPINAGAGR